jgi:cyanophycinase
MTTCCVGRTDFAHCSGRLRTLLVLGGMLMALAGCASTPESASSPSHHLYAIGDVEAPRPGATRPALLLMGGGDWPVEAFRWFMAAAGNGRVVVLRAAGTDDLQQEIWDDIGGVTALQTIVFHDRRAAFDPEVLAILQAADGIFLGGGDQANYINYWTGTPVQAALNAHVRAGKPLGGTSAGLAVQGRFAYGSLDGDSMDSPRALADPLRSGVTLVKDFLNLPGLEHVITDSHFAKRGRQGRLVAYLARLAHDHGNEAAGVVGLGIDEESALCLEPDGTGKVYSRVGGYAWLVETTQPAAPLVPGQPLRQSGIRFTGIGTDGRLERIATTTGSQWRAVAPAFVKTYAAAAGHLTETPAP